MSKKVVCFGEVLWDLLPSGKEIGGAPLNVALRLNSLNISTTIISRVGNDEHGRKLVEYLESKGLNSLIQEDSIYNTGLVDVKINDSGNASYEIQYPAAWDHIEYENSAIKTVSSADVFIYGSLACRNEKSASTLFKLLKKAKYKVFDLNLRKPYYKVEILLKLMEEADLIKVNEEELNEICELLGERQLSIAENMKFLSRKTNTGHLCVTRGACGVILLHKDNFYHNTGHYIKVKDSIGAGDSFLAGYISNLIKGQEPNIALDYACAIGSIVATKKGANSEVTMEEVNTLMWHD
ncbi:carbohydrate kinase [Gramella sp. AN32]|uniref:Carbohydrate kinase n=1 Tax=Christiangramia antarctica TaxID=2058158 RepID=A0ABW5X9U0_9FLAO|nr:carbohydrate kinase [Gramella sp. AN32]MCM4155470.1 carbohydrate kinase [Gramella sp. AN32]